MRKKLWLMMLALVLVVLAGCGNKADSNDELDGLTALEVEFEVPETLDVGETLVLEAIVTYGGESVEDADEVVFEVWERGKQDESEKIDSKNNRDGTYTAEVTFEEDGIYEMYAHTTAREMHTMPKREVTVGEGGHYEDEHDDHHDHHGFHTEGFDLHFMEPEDVIVTEETELMTHIMLNEKAFEDLNVRYEIWNDDISENHDWIDVDEKVSGEYTATHTFSEPGTYNIQIHVEDDKELHEHATYEIEVSE
jgi:plastocyanin